MRDESEGANIILKVHSPYCKTIQFLGFFESQAVNIIIYYIIKSMQVTPGEFFLKASLRFFLQKPVF